MKRNTTYLVCLAVFIAAVFLIYFRFEAKEKNKEARLYDLLERKGNSAQSEEWKNVRSRATTLLTKLRDNRDDAKSLISLANLYIQEARITGNYMYYDQAAMKYVNDVLKQDPDHFEALTLKALVFLSEHHFAEALAIAQKAVAINPYNAFVYGLLTDAHVEMGNYKAAIESLDKMVSIRPDIRSYSRISYLREIHGDYPGAIEAMKMAVEAGAPGDETTAWTRVQLGGLYEKTGDLKNAEMHYTIALNDRPGYAYALAGLGRLAADRKNYEQAISYYQQADSMVNDYSLKDELSNIYLLKGEKEKAGSIAQRIVDDMTKAAAQEKQQDSTGHYSDRELAYAYLKVGDPGKALEYAMAEYNRRPENIDINEMMAWVYYSKGEYTKALPYLKIAMRTNSRNPTLLCRAGLIYSKTGDKAAAKAILLDVLARNLAIPDELKSEGRKTLQTL